MPPNMAMLLGKTMADHHRFRGYHIFRQIHVQSGCFDRETRRTIHLSYPHYVPIRFQLRRFTAIVLIVTPQAVDGTIHSFYSRSKFTLVPRCSGWLCRSQACALILCAQASFLGTRGVAVRLVCILGASQQVGNVANPIMKHPQQLVVFLIRHTAYSSNITNGMVDGIGFTT